jgi:hypothetical protein
MKNTMQSLIAKAEVALAELDEAESLWNQHTELAMDTLNNPNWGPETHASARKGFTHHDNARQMIAEERAAVLKWLERARAEEPNADERTVKRAARRWRNVCVLSTCSLKLQRKTLAISKEQHQKFDELCEEHNRLTGGHGRVAAPVKPSAH